MDKIRLNIQREKSFVGAVMTYKVSVNGSEVGKIAVGGSFSTEILNEQTALTISMADYSMTIHKIEKEVVLFPQYCKSGVINCTVKTKANWLGILTYGLFQAVGKMELNIEYQ